MAVKFEKDSAQAWKERIVKELKGAPYEKVLSETADGIEIQPFYVNEQRKTVLDSGPRMPWAIHQDFTASQGEKNKLILQSLQAGVDSISVTADDLDEDLEGVHLEMIRIEVGGEDFHMLWPEYLESKGLDLNALKGGYAFDPYGGMIQSGQFEAISMIPAIVPMFAGATAENPNWKSLLIEGDRYHNAGATAVQELAYTLSQVNAYQQIDDALLGDMGIRLAAGTDYFETASKLRAFRILWANLAKAYGQSDNSVDLCATSSRMDLAPVDQHGNLLRATSQCMAAVVGGADRVSLLPFDGGGDEFSFRMARNIQKLLLHESYLDKNLNPMKGAYLFEEMTSGLATKAWELFKSIEEKGGWLKAVQDGSIQSEVMRSAEAWAKAINDGDRTWLGVNLYPDSEQPEWKGVEVGFDGKALPSIKSR